ncbi:MAG: alpha/beta hydrolase [Candidatus Schekmanbacteria bacterium]|nr:alpha/beta hydrolase [Candidatus Schekmanbacteria bacterium]
MFIITSEGLKVYYEVKGEGQPLLLLHGWGASSFGMRSLLEHFSARFKVYAFDLPGFGQSGEPVQTWGSREYADCIFQIRQKLGIGRAHLMAHSFGGRLAVILAAQHPELTDKVVLTGSAGLVPQRDLGYYVKIYSAKLGKGLLDLAGNPGKKLHRRLLSRLGSADYKSASVQMRAILAKVVNEDLSAFLPQIKAPTLLVWGDQDTATPLEMGRKMKQAIPASKLVIFSGHGHFAFIEKSGEFCRIVDDFLM